MRTRNTASIPSLLLAAAFALGLAAGCDDQTKSPDEGGDGGKTLCSEYSSCNACIAGQQKKGKTGGEAETQCGAAVTGCWVTWEKPVVCGDEEMKKEEG